MKYVGSIWLALMLLITWGCQQQNEALYQAENFRILNDGVQQGNNVAKVISPKEISSNYQSLAHESFSRLITFKFSINEKDNEHKPGADHRILIGSEHESPVIVFGEETKPIADPGTKLPPNYKYTFRVDMSGVLKQMEEKGYYEAYDGSKIAKSDFKGVYIAGGSAPLSWDFVNLQSKNLQLTDPDKDGIYEITVVFNPYDPNNAESKTWKATVDVSDKAVYESDQPLVDALFNLSLEEARQNIEADSTLRTGAKWGGVWTRDVSYSILLAFAYHEPEVAKISLMKKVKRDRIIQDTGSGGAWPVSSDRTTWALGAWEVYKVTGEQAWLETAYKVIKNTLDDDYKTIRSAETGMYSGESSFLDWREQTYPKWMSNMDIFVSQNLGTNVVHYQAHIILVEMAKLLQQPHEVYQKRADEIKAGINKYLWMQDKGYYAQFLYGRTSLQQSQRFEALGEALAVLFDVADEQQAKSIVAKSPVTEYGTTCIYPQIPNIPPYHNNGIWPFVQSYWNMAAAKAGNEAVLNHGLAAVYRAAGLFLTNYENMVAQNGDYMGTEINSHRMLWSMAGNLAMVHRVFMGMSFQKDGLYFRPVVPKAYAGTKRLSNFKYRNAVLDITVAGHGNQVVSFAIDGKEQDAHFVPADLSGKHAITIRLANNNMDKAINLVPNHFTLTNPQAKREGNKIRWQAVEGAVSYRVFLNGIFSKEVTNTEVEITTTEYTEYTVSAVDAFGEQSFVSEPIAVYPAAALINVEVEDHATPSNLPYSNYSGKGFVKISASEHRTVTITVEAPENGNYWIDFVYANGTGPWNTDNNCAIRSLYANDQYAGVCVMPQRGTDEWSDWGFTNAIAVKLNKGSNQIKLVFEEWNTNMDGEINEAVLDYMRVIKQ